MPIGSVAFARRRLAIGFVRDDISDVRNGRSELGGRYGERVGSDEAGCGIPVPNIRPVFGHMTQSLATESRVT